MAWLKIPNLIIKLKASIDETKEMPKKDDKKKVQRVEEEFSGGALKSMNRESNGKQLDIYGQQSKKAIKESNAQSWLVRDEFRV